MSSSELCTICWRTGEPQSVLRRCERADCPIPNTPSIPADMFRSLSTPQARVIAKGLLPDGLDVSKLSAAGREELRSAIDVLLFGERTHDQRLPDHRACEDADMSHEAFLSGNEEMLAALKEIVGSLQGERRSTDKAVIDLHTLDRARAIIAKAENAGKEKP